MRFKTSIYLFAILAFFACNSPKEKQQKKTAVEKPNVVVIFTDDMNFEDIGALGGKTLTPTLDKLMNEGVSFTNFRDCSAVCSPSRYNLLTGRYASRSKELLEQFPTTDPAFLRWNVDINMEERTVAHVLKENGYYTGFVGKYHNLQNEHLQDEIPATADMNDQEIQKRIRANYTLLKDTVQKTSGFDFVENAYINNLHALALPKPMQHHNMDWITAGAIDFLNTTSNEKPFFLYFATTLPHKPAPIKSMYADARITPSGLLEEAPKVQPDRKKVIERVKKAGFKEEDAPYTWLDDAVAVLVKKLEEMGELENTVILFASDHGGNNAKMTSYDLGVRAPAFAYWKNHFEAGKKIDKMTANIDFAPTIYDLCGIKVKDTEVVDGKSFLPLINDEKTDWRKSLFLEITYTRAVVADNFKYIAVRFPDKIQKEITPENNNEFNQEGTRFSANSISGPQKVRYQADQIFPGYFDRDQLYDLSKDPDEKVNLAKDPNYAEKLKEMKSLLKQQVVQFPHAFGEFTKEEASR